MLYSSIAVNFSLVLDMLLLLLFFSTIHQNNVLAKVGDVVEVAEHEQHIFGCTQFLSGVPKTKRKKRQ